MDQAPDTIPANQFVPDDNSAAPPIQNNEPIVISPQGTRVPNEQLGLPADVIPADKFVPDSESYGTPGQMAVTAAEGVGQGLIGPLAPGAEVALGVNPEDIRLRAQTNPWTHGLGEAAGFIGGALTGTGEAALVGKAGEAIAGLGEAASISGRLAAGAVKLGTEMALIQAGDEGTKAITLDPNQSVGSVISNIGLSGALGALTGGTLSGLGMAGATVLDKLGLNSENLAAFKDRLLYRGANLNPNEQMQNELKGVMDYFDEQGSEIGGANGLKSQALGNLMPKTVTPEISQSVQDIVNNSQEALQKMAKEGVPDRLITKFQSKLQDLMEVVTDPQSSVADHYDAINDYKKDLANFSKGNFGPWAVPAHSEAYDFLKITKDLGHGIKESLEDPAVWGDDVAGLQKDINGAWKQTLDTVKQVKSKFMAPVGDEFVVDPAKFNTYVNQAGRATSETARQQILGKFLDGMENFHDAVSNIYEKAGLTPPDPPGMGALKESLNKPSIGAKLADAWYDKLASKALGTTVGGAVGGAVGHAIPIPGAGYAGVVLGGKLGESVLPSFIQPLLEKATNSAAFNASAKFGENVLKGDSLLQKSTKALFQGGQTIPQHFMPSKDLMNLDDKLKDFQKNPKDLFGAAGNLGYYMPQHAQALSQAAMNAVNYLNAQRPQNAPKQSPLDANIEPTKAQESAFHRTLAIAQQPLTIMQHIKQGTLLPQDVNTLKTLYPSYYNKMSQELHNAMTDHLSKDGKIPYGIRQSMSLFLGQPLDSVMSQPNIAAAQGVFIQQAAQKMAANTPQRAKKNTSKMGEISKQYQTGEQAAAARQSQA